MPNTRRSAPLIEALAAMAPSVPVDGATIPSLWSKLKAGIEAGEVRLSYLEAGERTPIPSSALPFLEIPTLKDLDASILAYRTGQRVREDEQAARARRYGKVLYIVEWHRFPGVLVETSEQSSAKAERDCEAWFRDLLKGKRSKTQSKASLRRLAQARFPRLSDRGFDRVWTKVAPDRFKRPGALKKQ